MNQYALVDLLSSFVMAVCAIDGLINYEELFYVYMSQLVIVVALVLLETLFLRVSRWVCLFLSAALVWLVYISSFDELSHLISGKSTPCDTK